MIPLYAWVTLSVLAGVIVLYFICLKLAANDWIGNVPSGPFHIPLAGCLFHLLRISNWSEYCDKLFLVYGNVVKYCIFRKTVVFIRDPQCVVGPLNEKLVKETTHLYVIDAIKSLGFPIPKSKSFLRSCAEIGTTIYNREIPIDEFRILMEACENYRSVLHEKKVENIIFTLTNEKITLDKNDTKDLEECSKEVEVFRSSIETAPQMYLPLAGFWPLFILKRKRVYKSVLKIQQKLGSFFYKKFPKESDEEVFNLFFVLYFFMTLSKTSPKRRKSAKQVVDLDVCPDGILSDSKADYQFSFDVCGLRFFKAYDYIKVLKYDIPTQALMISYSKE